MKIIDVRNVNDAFPAGLRLLSSIGINESSRAGEVISSPVPVTTIYSHPWERVLISPERDANPFFHLLEAVWMLAGSADGTFLDRFVKNFSSRFGENGLISDAYGYRWRSHFFTDQLLEVGGLLFNNPIDRRAVLTMWSPSADLGNSGHVPCNTHVYFRMRYDYHENRNKLDMTVCCRSNDMLWGAYGANAVHMSVMHEIVSALAGMDQGTYYQISNNFHAYTETIQKFFPPPTTPETNPYRTTLSSMPIVAATDKQERKDEAIRVLNDCVRLISGGADFETAFVSRTVAPMLLVHDTWKVDKNEAFEMTVTIAAPDWREACQNWMLRRIEKHERH